MPNGVHSKKPSRMQILIVGGLVLFVFAILVIKGKSSPSMASESAILPEQQLQQALDAGEPTAVFFHSLTCDSCTQMMDVVSKVHPEFADSVVLVDVNVSDTRNHDLLRAEDIQVIPTLVLYDRQGQRQIIYGTVPPDQLRQLLKILAGS